MRSLRIQPDCVQRMTMAGTGLAVAVDEKPSVPVSALNAALTADSRTLQNLPGGLFLTVRLNREDADRAENKLVKSGSQQISVRSADEMQKSEIRLSDLTVRFLHGKTGSSPTISRKGGPTWSDQTGNRLS